MKSFKTEVRSAFPGWDRYAVFMTAVCFDTQGAMTDYVNLTDKADVLSTPPCDHADLYIYVIAREFPASDMISKSPPFDIEIISRAGDSPAKTTTLAVNQWGGLSTKLSLT
jgi:hypothetical protein